MNMRIPISRTDADGHTEMYPIDFEAELPEVGDQIIDDVEQAVLALNKEVRLPGIGKNCQKSGLCQCDCSWSLRQSCWTANLCSLE